MSNNTVNKKEIAFVVYIIYSLAESWDITPTEVHEILQKTNVMNDYVIPCYDVLHTQGRQYLVDDITEFVRERGAEV